MRPVGCAFVRKGGIIMKQRTGRKLLRTLLAIGMVIGSLPMIGAFSAGSLWAQAYDGNPYSSYVNNTETVQFANSTWYIIADGSVAHYERHALLSVMVYAIRVRGDNHGVIALTGVGQDNIAGAVVPRNRDCHSGSKFFTIHYSLLSYSTVQLVFDVTVNEAEV